MCNIMNNKIIEYIFDPKIYEILIELENSNKDESYLENKLGITKQEIKKRLDYLLKHDFIKILNQNNNITYRLDSKKLSQIIEHSRNLDGITDGLTKINSFLN